jgi:pimeloyl-ACP methyl ester carboxylesterase
MQHFTTPDGLKLAYSDEGEGLPLLCLAGLTRNARDFDFVAPHLQGVRLIRMDYRGRGKSDRADWKSYTPPQEARDALALLDHLEVGKAAVLGTSRGGLIAMGLAAGVKDRLLGICLNDIGPVIDPGGLEVIMTYLGRNPNARSYEEAAHALAKTSAGFAAVPHARWLAMARNLFDETPDGLVINYDPHLRDAIEAANAQSVPDLWPMFDAMADLPLALVHGANSNLLGDATVAEMRRRRPDMIYGRVPDCGHVPFLDEPEALKAIHAWLEKMR